MLCRSVIVWPCLPLTVDIDWTSFYLIFHFIAQIGFSVLSIWPMESQIYSLSLYPYMDQIFDTHPFKTCHPNCLCQYSKVEKVSPVYLLLYLGVCWKKLFILIERLLKEKKGGDEHMDRGGERMLNFVREQVGGIRETVWMTQMSPW